MMPPARSLAPALPVHAVPASLLRRAAGNWTVTLAATVLGLMVAAAVFAPLLSSHSPLDISPTTRIKPPSAAFWFGTDMLGRDIYTRVLYGARTSLVVGVVAAVLSIALGLVFGLLAGYFRLLDAILMRIMDGIMSVPSIVLAVALVAVAGSSLGTVLVAIVIPEFPRVVRLVRGVILNARTEPYVEAAISMGTPLPRLLWLHMIPNTVAPLIVQGSFILASAILTEAALSFLGVGLPAEVPSWGNIMSDGRKFFQMLPGLIFFPGIFLALTVLSINLIGDVLRDALDPRLARRR
ncbi:ABC transporter permease [Frigidibacter sp. MR17.24]|uniref:ABC transporter permease n=1 Tax=Frigidibacter sp. MR17.24 TaxID=3127345 RepID=UPI0030131BD8